MRPFGFTGSSAMNSAQENSDCCGSGALSWWPFPLTGPGAWPFPFAWRPLTGTSSTVGPIPSSWCPLPFPLTETVSRACTKVYAHSNRDAAADLGLDRLLGHELGPGEQGLLPFGGFLAVAVGQYRRDRRCPLPRTGKGQAVGVMPVSVVAVSVLLGRFGPPQDRRRPAPVSSA